MAEFSVKDSRKLNSAAGVMRSKAGDVSSVYSTVSSARNNLGYNGAAYNSIRNTLNTIMGELDGEKNSLKSLSDNLYLIIGRYNQTEDRIIGNGIIGPYFGSSTSALGDTVATAAYMGSKVNWTEGVMKTVGKFGIVGSIAEGFYSLGTGVTSGDNIKVGKGIISFAKSQISTFGTLAKNAYSDNPKSTKEILFGDWTKGGALTALKVGTNATKGEIFKAAWKNEFTSYSFKNASNVGDKIKVGTKWAGTILSLVSNGISNYDEYSDYKDKGMTRGEAVARGTAETIVETGVDVLIGAAATAGATALLGAAAPAVAVGAASVAAVWAVNKVTERVTAHLWGEDNKKDLKELVSDAVIDGTLSIGKNVGNAVANTFGAITKWPIFG